MVLMAGFGDNSTVFQRMAVIPAGNMRIEVGCWTQATDATLYIPTKLTQIFCLVCVTTGITDAPCISQSLTATGGGGWIKGTLTDDATDKIVQYVAVGY